MTSQSGLAISIDIADGIACDNVKIIDNYAFNWLGITMKVTVTGEIDYDLKIVCLN